MDFFIFGIFVYIFTAFLALAFREKHKGFITAAGSAIGGVAVTIPAFKILFNNISSKITFNAGFPLRTITLEIDSLSAFFIVIIASGCLFCSIYAIGYLRPCLNQRRTIASHYFFLIILFISMLMLTVVRDALTFLIVWEAMSLSSFFLVVFENEKPEVFKAGITYLVMMHLSVLFLIAGFVILMNYTGKHGFAEFAKFFGGANRVYNDLLFILFFVGFGIKAGFMPLHHWLPQAHPAAPSHVSGLMSGVMIKLGIYGILRMLLVCGPPSLWICYMALAIALFSALNGIVYAAAQTDIKRLLAYSSVENIGIIGVGVGIGLLGMSYRNSLIAAAGFGGALLHIMNHSLFKALLFYGAGNIYLSRHTRDMEKLGGLGRKMPATMTLFLIGTLAICGLPPFNGFISEFILYCGLLDCKSAGGVTLLTASIITLALISLTGAIALLCFAKQFSIVFLGSSRSSCTEENNAISGIMLAPMAVMAFLCLATGLLPVVMLRLIEFPVAKLMNMQIADNGLKIATTLSAVSVIFVLLLGIVLIIIGVRYLLLKNKIIRQAGTWGCGYENQNSRMQYSASSFAMPFLEIFKPLLKNETSEILPDGLFPRKAFFSIKFLDRFEIALIYPVARTVVYILNKLSWIQSGNMQHYLFYGLCFLILAITWVVLW